MVAEFMKYLDDRGIDSLRQVSADVVDDYYSDLQYRPNQNNDGGLSTAYLNSHQQALRKFRQYLVKHDASPFPVRLRREKSFSHKLKMISQRQVKLLFHATDETSSERHFQHRDKVILVALYCCGLRRSEAVMLNVDDVVFDKQVIHVRQGKNYKERYVPINSFSMDIILDYLYQGRPCFSWADSSEALLVSSRSPRMLGCAIESRLKKLITAAGDPLLEEIGVTPHTLRHSIATHLLEQGMNIEEISQFLGHSSLESTQIYTHVNRRRK